jgi:hypothetical protein
MLQNILKIIRKKFLLFVGVLFTAFLSLLSFLLSSSSKDDSLFVSTASADIASWAGTDAGGGSGGGSCGGCSSGGGACFPRGVLISCMYGFKEVQDIVVGDIVVGFDIESGRVGEYAVVKTMKHSWEESGKVSPLIKITHENGSIVLTSNHQVYKKGDTAGKIKDFNEASSFKIGDYLTLGDGTSSKILEISKEAKYDFVYNFEVDKVHTYIASNVRVHNDK